ncbi:MAG: bifunctional riboflavin kinase/FMN adenylyltransferase [Vulcanimicrobiaceae bacterium]
MKIYHAWERHSTRPISLAVGFFDGMHHGHAELARQARLHRKPGGRVGVVTFANHPATYLRPGQEPELLATQEERVNAFARAGYEECWLLRFDERVASLTAPAFLDLLANTLHARALVTGSGFRFGHKRSGDSALIETYCAEHGIIYTAVDPVVDAAGERISSTRVRSLIAAGDMEAADRLLTSSYELRGSIELGFGRGHDLDFPTANLAVEPKLLPKDGVYSAMARFDGRDYAALVSIGTNPQFGGRTRTIEAWLRDFHLTCYGREIALRDFRFVRDQMTFPDVPSLMAMMQNDRQAVAYPNFG